MIAKPNQISPFTTYCKNFVVTSIFCPSILESQMIDDFEVSYVDTTDNSSHTLTVSSSLVNLRNLIEAYLTDEDHDLYIPKIAPKRSYKLKKDDVDHRDFEHFVHPEVSVALPSSVDLRNLCAPVYDQGQLGSCTANAGIACREFMLQNKVKLSRLFLYYEERNLEGTVSEDSGASMRDICKALASYGACQENLDPYVESKFAVAPSSAAVADANNYKIRSYHSVLGLTGIKNVLALSKSPVLMGMTVYNSFESDSVAKTGVMPMPFKGDKVLGGHAVLAVGYDDSKSVLIVRNSWGASWGDKGYFYMPYAFVNKGFASDFWTLF
jgi:C1A family cysteine protease